MFSDSGLFEPRGVKTTKETTILLVFRSRGLDRKPLVHRSCRCDCPFYIDDDRERPIGRNVLYPFDEKKLSIISPQTDCKMEDFNNSIEISLDVNVKTVRDFI